MEQNMVAREAGAGERRSADRLFHRDLPGGGYVAIELSGAPASGRTVRVVVERRGDRARRVGHKPPVILEEAWAPDRGFGDLYRMACDNVAIARGILRLAKAD